MNVGFLLSGLLAVLFGLALLIWRERLVQNVGASRKRLWHYKYGRREFRSARVVAIGRGVGFVLRTCVCHFVCGCVRVSIVFRTS